MKYYKQDNLVYGYELDGSQDYLIGDKVAMTAEEVEAHFNPPITLEQAKASKTYELEQAFETNSKTPISVGLKTYNGGKGSAQSLRDYIQLVQESGGTEYQIWDTSNVISTYTLAEANAIKLAVGAAVAQAEFTLRNKKNLVDSATTILEVEAVTW